VGDDLDELRRRLAPALRQAVAGLAPSLHRQGLRDWPGGTLPRTIEMQRDGARVVGYPALIDEGASVGVRVLPSAAEQAVAMRSGIRRLLLLTLPSPARAVLGALSARDKLALARDTGGHAAEAVRDAIAAAVDALVQEAGGPPWEESTYDALRSRVDEQLPQRAAAVLRDLAQVHAIAHEVREQLTATQAAAAADAVADMRAQLEELVPPDVATTLGAARLHDVARYLTATRLRAERLPRETARDLALMDRVHAVEDAWHEALDALPRSVPVPTALAEVRWMLQELRVSLFAQQLGTAHPVSEKRILQAIAAARQGA
jgi:ATP-dependent helicase HrpA